MSKSTHIILFVGIGLFISITYLVLNSTNDLTSYNIIPLDLNVTEKLRGGSVCIFSVN